MLFPPLPPTAPDIPPHLRWSLAGEIRHDEQTATGCHVYADVYQTRDGWTWTAEYWAYRPDLTMDPDEPAFEAIRRAKAGPHTYTTEAQARTAAEAWIVLKVGGRVA